MTEKEAAKRGLDWWNSNGRRSDDTSLVVAIGRLLAERDAFQEGMAREAAERYRLNRALVALADGAGFTMHSRAEYSEWATRVLTDKTLYAEK